MVIGKAGHADKSVLRRVFDSISDPPSFLNGASLLSSNTTIYQLSIVFVDFETYEVSLYVVIKIVILSYIAP